MHRNVRTTRRTQCAAQCIFCVVEELTANWPNARKTQPGVSRNFVTNTCATDWAHCSQVVWDSFTEDHEPGVASRGMYCTASSLTLQDITENSVTVTGQEDEKEESGLRRGPIGDCVSFLFDALLIAY